MDYIPKKRIECPHEKWTTKEIPLSDGRPSLREFCVMCGMSNGGSRLGFALPIIRDSELYIQTYKHVGKTLGEIAKIDKEYLRWVVVHSRASDRVKKSAARLYFGKEYIPHKNGETYPKKEIYDTHLAREFIVQLINESL